MRILGIDPGIATIGFGVVDTAGPRISLVKCTLSKGCAGGRKQGAADGFFSGFAL